MTMNIGFIGCGGFAEGNHIPNVMKNPEFAIRAFCDLNENILEQLKTKVPDAYTTTDMIQLFVDPEIEAIICSTKPDVRMPIMEAAVKYGKHLFVEKPLCYDDDQIEAMNKLILNSDIKFMVGFNRPYSPMMQDVKSLYKQHRKGNTTIIYRIIGEGIRLWPQHHYDAIIKHAESTIIHEATHIFDLLNWLTDSFPTSVYAAGGGNVDNIITLEYPHDVTAVVISGDNANAGVPKEYLEINTNSGCIKGHNFIELEAFGWEKNEYINKTYDYTIGDKVVNSSMAVAEEKLRHWRQNVTPEQIAKGYYYDTIPKEDKGHYNELEFFRRAVAGEVEIETGIIAGAVTQLTASTGIKSYRQKQAIQLDFTKLI
ncbi:MAG: Gfo/Idh/MocA family oxidoreductase [Victivallaceae bacterium]|nr:Gfo/Idh/MocA family oxidoreductase [Victivallaceae bacterium]